MSLLRAEGHTAAARYPLAFMWNEVRFVRKRQVSRISTEAVIMNAVIAQAVGGGKVLKEALESLEDGNQ